MSQKKNISTEEMAQWLGLFLASAEDLDLISTWWFTTACNSIRGASDGF